MMSSEQVEQVRKQFEAWLLSIAVTHFPRDTWTGGYAGSHVQAMWQGYLARAQQEHAWREKQEPVAWAVWVRGELRPRLVFLNAGAAEDAIARWAKAYANAVVVPVYAAPEPPK